MQDYKPNLMPRPLKWWEKYPELLIIPGGFAVIMAGLGILFFILNH